MPVQCSTLAARSTMALALMLATAAWAQAPAEVYRCGNAYGSTPCPGGQVVAADDARSAAQRQQALAARQQDARLAQGLAADRQAREQAAAGQAAARIGPSAAERAHADKLAAKKQQAAPPSKKKKKVTKPRRAA